jgi:hypothetical protein
MADKYGAAQPLMDLANKYYKTTTKILNAIPTPSSKKDSSKKEDTSWHDEMVRKATESFAKDQQKRGTVVKWSGASGRTGKYTHGKKRTKKGSDKR